MILKSEDLVSIVIPVYNDISRLIRCLDAIALQSYPIDKIEVIVVDNGSTIPISLTPPTGLETRVVQCTKPGSYAARNAGVKVASGSIIAFTDADCWPDIDWLKYSIDAIHNKFCNAFVGGEVKIVKSSEPSAVELYQYIAGFDQEGNIKSKKFTGTLALTCSKKLFNSVGNFNEELLSGGDREWSWRAIKKGYSILYEPKSIIYTEPRTTLRGAIIQARRVAAGRKMLQRSEFAHAGENGIKKKRTTAQSLQWILTLNEISFIDKARIITVAAIIRIAEFLEILRLHLGRPPERR